MDSSILPVIPAVQSWCPATGFFHKRDFNPETLAIRLDLPPDAPDASQEILEPGAVDESYDLLIEPDGLTLSAHTRSGLFRGRQTVRQLMAAAGDSLPCGQIHDAPAYRWRGMLLDCGRHFMPLSLIKETIDQLAYHKFNVLHWHLTEDQGWRLEIPAYPRLTEVGAWRREPDGSRYGGFYSTADVREIVAYAAERFITIVPEIEMPGHSVAALAAYPALSCTGDSLAVQNQWGIFKDVYCAGNDQTFEFLEDVLSTVMEMFPSRYIHIGGDECPKDRWRACEKCQQRLARENLSGENELQSWFIRRIEKFLIRHQRRLIGWDEILEGGLAPEATVQSWRGTRGAIVAAQQGHDAIVSPTTHCYFDYDVAQLDLRKVYSFDPRPRKLNPDESRHILGGEMNLWTEYIPPERVPNMLYPRLTAMAECLWTSNPDRDFAEFLDRLAPHLAVLKSMGIAPGPADRPVTVNVDRRDQSGLLHLKIEMDQDLRQSLKKHPLQLRWKVVDRSRVTGYRPDLRVEDMGLPPVTLQDGLVPKNGRLDWPPNPEGTAELLLVQLFLADRPYGTPAVLERENHRAAGRSAVVDPPWSERYTPPNTPLLTDGLYGSRDFRDGHWAGFEGTDLNLTVDLGSVQNIDGLSMRFFQGTTAWIFLPDRVDYLVSDNGRQWRLVGTVRHHVSPLIQERVIHQFSLEGLKEKARWIRVVGHSRQVCPEGHPGAGQPCWIFGDEFSCASENVSP